MDEHVYLPIVLFDIAQRNHISLFFNLLFYIVHMDAVTVAGSRGLCN